MKKAPFRWPSMSLLGAIISFVALVLGGCSPAKSQQSNGISYWPSEVWRSSAPEKQGLDSKVLNRIDEYVVRDFPKTSSVLIVRNGYIVFEEYYAQGGPNDPRALYCVTKSLIAVITGIAIEQGLIESTAKPIYEYLPDSIRQDMSADARKITVHHLLSMTSGFNDNGGTGTSDPGLLSALLKSGLSYPPGERFAYNGNNANLLSVIITQTSGLRASEFAQKHLFDRIGVKQVTWLERSAYTSGYSDARMTSRDMAKIGYLFLRKGKWNNIQVVPESWVAECTKKHTPIPTEYQTPGIDDAYGYLWWTMWYDKHSAFSAIGYDGQRICVIPDSDLVIVFTGTGGGFAVEHLPIIQDCILASLTEK